MNKCQTCNSPWFVWNQASNTWFCAECGTIEAHKEVIEAQEAIDWLLDTMNLTNIEVKYERN